MRPDDATVQKLKAILEKKMGKEISWEEAAENARSLMGYAEIAYDIWEEDEKRKKKLEESPKGFHLEGEGYTCFICGNHISNEETLYDEYGIKCLLCQKAIDKKIIPPTTASNKNSWYSKYDLEDRFKIDRQALKKFIKLGILKARIVPGLSNFPRTYIFLIKDNKDTLPPKKFTESKLVKEVIDGKEWYHSEPWYRFVNPQIALKGYKILDYLKFAEARNADKTARKTS